MQPRRLGPSGAGAPTCRPFGPAAGSPHRIEQSPDAADPPGGDRPGMTPPHASEDTPVVRELRELEQVAEVGTSDKTPLILTGAVALVCSSAFLVILGLALLAYRVAA